MDLRAYGIVAQAVSGTGPDGRITAADVAVALRPAAGTTTAAPTAATSPAVSAAAPAPSRVEGTATYVDLPHNQIRRVVARRLLESKQTVPHYYLTMECKVGSAHVAQQQVYRFISRLLKLFSCMHRQPAPLSWGPLIACEMKMELKSVAMDRVLVSCILPIGIRIL